MASLFDRDSGAKPPPGPYSRDRIADEISHLQKRGSVRHGDARQHGYRALWPALLTLCLLGALFVLDPVEHALKRGEAIRVYLYLHHFGSDNKAGQLLATGVFNRREIELLNQRTGEFQGYYPGPVQAAKVADGIVAYFRNVSFLQAGAYDQLGPLGKLRYQFFVRWGLRPPTKWEWLDPAIRD